MSIHPSIHYLPSRGGKAKQDIPDNPLPSNTFQLLLGDPKAFTDQMRYAIPPAGFWEYQSVSTQLDLPRRPPEEGAQEKCLSDA